MKLASAFCVAAALTVASGAAHAALFNVNFVASPAGYQGPTPSVGFESPLPLGSLPNGYNEAGYTFTPSGSVQVKTPPNDGQGAFPFGDTSLQYLSVLGGASVDIAPGAPATRIGFYWGSIDTYNTVEFYKGNVLVGSLTGFDVAPLGNNGNQFSFATNRFVTIGLLSGTYDYVRLSSSSNSFEIDNISAGVPEPSTWAMMLLGFIGVAVLGVRRRRPVVAA